MARLFWLLVGVAGASRTLLNQRAKLQAVEDTGIVKEMDFKHKLRVCNAYPTESALEVSVNDRKHVLTKDTPLAYKQCRDFREVLNSGDKLIFSVGDVNAGTFSIADLPSNDATLFLAIYRHDRESTAVSFVSHVFANLLNAQIAVIDTYKGKDRKTNENSMVKIADVKANQGRSEELRYNSVVAVNPGKYEAVIEDNGKVAAKQEVVTLDRESYVILRVGVEADSGKTFPEELVVFPQSDSSLLKKGAASTSVFVAMCMALISAFVTF